MSLAAPHSTQAESGSLSLLSVGHFHPPIVLDNDFLTSLDIGVDTNWVIERVGIRERHTVLPLDYIRDTRNRDPRASAEASSFSDAQTGAKAAEHALSRAGLTAKDIGMVISGGCSPQLTIPAQACLTAAELQIECPAFDVNSACSSFAAQLHLLSSMRPETLPDYVLIVNVENTTRTVDYNDRRTAVLWGDCTSAAIVSPRAPGRAAVKASVLHSDPSGWKHVKIPAGGHFYQDGQAVQGFAIRKTIATLSELGATLPKDSLPTFIGHQANFLMLDGVCRRAEIPPERHFFNVDRFGNCGAAGAPSVLSQNWEKIKGGYLSLVVVGSGLTWGGVSFYFPESFPGTTNGNGGGK
jgi:3-oxoacyl-[acyl-carrier-protein] synthase-3